MKRLPIIVGENGKQCRKCMNYTSYEFFTKLKTGKYHSQCHSCRANDENDRRRNDGVAKKKFAQLAEGYKLCAGCNSWLPNDAYSPSPRSAGGLAYMCKPCRHTKHYDKDKAREAAYKHRKENRSVYLERHRLYQFYRKHRIRVSSDGSVTKAFLDKLYDQENCTYCKTYTELQDRTMDHVIPLICGGLHTATNLVMACFECNSSKGSQTLEEFMEKLNVAIS